MNHNHKQKFYMCPPKYFEIKHILNDWMDAANPADSGRAMEQWESLRETYERLGASVSLIDPVEGIPELNFAGDAIFLFGGKAISSKFRFKERQPEVAPMAAWFENLGYSVHSLPEGVLFEGNAEAIRWNGAVVGGYGVRSDQEAYNTVSEILDVEIIPVRLREPYYHLDTAFCPINEDAIAYVPEAFDMQSRELVSKLAKNTIAIGSEEARLMACNSKAVGDTVVVSTKQAPNFVREVMRLGFNVVELELSEFRKAGAGAKCLTLEAY
jgi:N-dimethylarginine dimethylaminohydrolase